MFRLSPLCKAAAALSQRGSVVGAIRSVPGDAGRSSLPAISAVAPRSSLLSSPLSFERVQPQQQVVATQRILSALGLAPLRMEGMGAMSLEAFAGDSTSTRVLEMDSVLRKRRKKMNKHKLQKRRKLERRAHKR